MSNYVNINGQLIKTELATISPKNRAFCYGDGIFETIRCLNSRPLFFDKHFHRLRNALHLLKMDVSPEHTENYFRRHIHNLLQRCRIYKGARVRIQFFRNEGGLYSPTNNSAGFLITADPLENETFGLNMVGHHIDVYSGIPKPVNFLSQFKTSSALLFVMAGHWRKEKGLDDCFIVNQEGKIIETLASNVFLVNDNNLITPSVESGCVDGTMRRTIMEIAAKKGIHVIETDGFSVNQILAADELFTTNAIAGIQWISAFGDKRYFHTLASKLISFLNEEVDVLLNLE